MISAALADELLQQYEGLGWEIKAALVHVAMLARDDDELRRVADPELLKVGPKGYIHGWIFVGVPGVGAAVNHPQHGKGTVTGHDGKHVTVKFAKGTHTFEAHEGAGKGKLVERGAHGSALADRVARDPKQIKGMSHDDLKAVDDEFTRRAGALGKKDQVSATHQKVKDALAKMPKEQEAGKVVPKEEPKSDEYKKLSDAAFRYNATTAQDKNGHRSLNYIDPDKQQEAIRLHTAARRAAPDAKSKKRHTDEINRHKGYLSQIENNRNTTDFEQGKKETEAKLKDVERGHALATAEGQDEAAKLNDHLADLHEKRSKELTARGGGGQNGHDTAAQRHRGRADFHRQQAEQVREKHKSLIARILEMLPGARAKVQEREEKARQTRKKADIDHAVAGHEEIARHARIAGKDDIADEHEKAAKKLQDEVKPKKQAKSKVPGLTEEGAKEPKVETPWGTMHPADLSLQHPGASLSGDELRSAHTELERRGATEEGKDKVSRAYRQVGKDLAAHERFEKEAAKPGGLNDFERARKGAKEAGARAEAEGTSEAHQVAADAHRTAQTLAYKNDHRAVAYHRESANLHQLAANRLKAEERAENPPEPTPAPKDPGVRRRSEPRGAKAEPKEQTPDDLSKKASRTGAREDHVKASVAQHQAGNRSKASTHRQAVESIDASDEFKDEAEQHADAAERTDDPELHRAAAESYRGAAEHMDDVPGGKKAAADLRSKADEHDNIATRIIKATAAYAKAFLHANRTGNAADKSGSATDHREAAAAHRAAGAASLSDAQRRHHSREAVRHETAADAVDAETSVSAA